MLIFRVGPLFLLFFTLSAAYGQETSYGISLPITISGGAGYTHGPEDRDIGGAFRAVVTPSLNFGPHWFAYAALETRSSSYLGYSGETEDNRAINFTAM